MVDIADSRTASWSEVAVGYQRAIRSFDEFVKPVLAMHGLDHLGLTHVLFLIGIGDKPRRIVDMVRDEHYAGSNASYALTHLDEANLVVRRPDADDARIRVVALTDRGRELLASIREASAGDPRQIDAALRTITAFEQHVGRSPAISAQATEPAE